MANIWREKGQEGGAVAGLRRAEATGRGDRLRRLAEVTGRGGERHAGGEKEREEKFEGLWGTQKIFLKAWAVRQLREARRSDRRGDRWDVAWTRGDSEGG